MGDWKAVRTRPNGKIELYNLSTDLAEQHNVADKNPEILARMAELLRTARTKSDVFPLYRARAHAFHRA